MLAIMSCSINSVMILIAWFNVPEFLFYMAIYVHEKRYAIIIIINQVISHIVNCHLRALIFTYATTCHFQIKCAAHEIHWSDHVGSKKEKQDEKD